MLRSKKINIVLLLKVHYSVETDMHIIAFLKQSPNSVALLCAFSEVEVLLWEMGDA